MPTIADFYDDRHRCGDAGPALNTPATMQETRAAVDVQIRNVLYEQILDSMFDWLEAYRKAIYEHIYTHYKEAA